MTSLAGQDTLSASGSRTRPYRLSPVTVGLVIVLLAVLVLAVFGPMISPHDRGEVVSLPFDAEVGIFGTDHLGRDVLSRILHGGRPIVIIPAVATVLATVIGGMLGVAAAALQRDDLIMRVMDVFAVIPSILIALVLFHRFGAQHWVLALAVILASIPFTTRYARAAAFPIIHSAYVEQARMIGESAPNILIRDVVPNLARPLLADAGLRFIGAIYLVAAAGFIGFGPPPPSTDWGSMISEIIGGAGLNPWATVAPSLMVLLLTIPTNLLADRFARQVAR